VTGGRPINSVAALRAVFTMIQLWLINTDLKVRSSRTRSCGVGREGKFRGWLRAVSTRLSMFSSRNVSIFCTSELVSSILGKWDGEKRVLKEWKRRMLSVKLIL